MNENLIFDYRLRFIRERNGIKQEDIANLLGLNKSTYSNYEGEKYIIPLKYLIVFCDYFNVSLDYIFGFSKNLNYPNYVEGINSVIAGQRLRNLRGQLKETQMQFSANTNNKRTNISGYELGKYLISTTYLYNICKQYNISADYLLGKVNNPKEIKIN